MWYGAGLLAVSAIGLREGAERIAQASVLSETVVTAAAQAGRELFVVNSPIVVADRYLVVTDQSQFDSAATVLNLPRRTIALNYAYVESRADNRCDAYWQDGRIIASVDVGRRSFLTLDGTGVADTAALVGRSQSGHFASYRVTALSRGHIARVEITPSSSAIVPASTRTWSAGQLTPLQ